MLKSHRFMIPAAFLISVAITLLTQSFRDVIFPICILGGVLSLYYLASTLWKQLKAISLDELNERLLKSGKSITRANPH